MNYVSIEQRPSWADWDGTLEVDQVRSCKQCSHCFRLVPEPGYKIAYYCVIMELVMLPENLTVGVGNCKSFKIRTGTTPRLTEELLEAVK